MQCNYYILELNFDTNKILYGSINYHTINQAFKTLNELHDSIVTKKHNTILFDLSKKYYSIIP